MLCDASIRDIGGDFTVNRIITVGGVPFSAFNLTEMVHEEEASQGFGRMLGRQS